MNSFFSIYLFILGSESLLLPLAFSSCGAWASHYNGFCSVVVAQT